MTSTLDAPEQHSGSRWLNGVALTIGLGALVLGPVAGGLLSYLSLRGRQTADAVSVTTVGVSMAVLGLGIGGALVWAGYQGLRRRLSPPFRPGMIWFWGCLVGLGLSLPIGQLILLFDLLAPVTFPLFHVLAVALPAILILVLVGHGVKHNTPAPSRRQMLGQVALGAFGVTVIAFTIEVMVAMMGLFIVGVGMALSPGGLAQLAELQALLANPAGLQDPQVLARWLLKPGILFSVTVMLVIVVPLIEELVKSIGVPLIYLGMRRVPSPAQAWLWGIAVGTGFAVTEGLFNGAANLPFWVGIALLRIGATAMHLVTAGLTGLGWMRLLASRRFLSLLGAYLTSVVLHSAWNGLTVLMAVSSLWIMAQPGDATRLVGGGLGILIGLTGLMLLTGIIIGTAAYVTRRVRATVRLERSGEAHVDE
ncbi:MAG: PrsW family intramembrane metalloprotease [Anaerolineales bacterium]|nr:MAG: PrsW family intramembrane metalloprotease [Anaerolineales bacterium]